jgi:transcriptional regulator with XRE-family HTH domain
MSSTSHVALSVPAAYPIGPQQLVAWAYTRTGSLVLMLGEKERRERFAYALQQALRARTMSERELAKRMGIDARRVAKWRSGKGLPDYYEMLALADTLRVKEDLFRNPEPVPPPPPEPHYPIEDYLLEAADSGAAEGHRRATNGPTASTPGTPTRMPARRARAVEEGLG